MTAQIPDSIWIDGTEQFLYNEPLESYWESKQRPRPQFEPSNTANWRGYVAKWEIKNDRLYVTHLTARFCDLPPNAPKPGFSCEDRGGKPRAATLQDIFPRQAEPVLADWYSGVLTVPMGKVTAYAHMGYETRYEFYLLLTIEKGVVKSRFKTDKHPGERLR